MIKGMPAQRRRRLFFAATLVTAFGAAAALALYAFEENLLYFYTPAQLAPAQPGGEAARAGRAFNLGGVVVDGSVRRAGGDAEVRFALSDGAATVQVRYTGLLPDLFREGQGVVATGRLNAAGEFVADRVLAKHDENYMPPEVAEALQGGGAPLGVPRGDRPGDDS